MKFTSSFFAIREFHKFGEAIREFHKFAGAIREFHKFGGAIREFHKFGRAFVNFTSSPVLCDSTCKYYYATGPILGQLWPHGWPINAPRLAILGYGPTVG